MNKTTRYAPEIRERAVRLVFEHQADYDSQWAALNSIAAKIGCTAETLRKWVRQAERDQGLREGLTSSDRERLKALERENRELKRANEILRKASAFFAQAELSTADPGNDCLYRRAARGLRSRADLQAIANCRIHLLRAQGVCEADPDREPERVKRDRRLKTEIRRVWDENLQVYGVKKVWRQLNREAIPVTRCTVRTPDGPPGPTGRGTRWCQVLDDPQRRQAG